MQKQFNNELFLIKVYLRGLFRIEKSSPINFSYRTVSKNLSLMISNHCSFAIEKNHRCILNIKRH